jgi:hypothetical protein
MADTKISALPASTTPLAGTEVLPIVQSGTTKQVSVANLTAGRVISANGVAFPATASASSDPNTLDDYEEGAWTPGFVNGTFTLSGFNRGHYTVIGRQVTATALLIWSASSGTGDVAVTLPFTAGTEFGRYGGSIGTIAGVDNGGPVLAKQLTLGLDSGNAYALIKIVNDNATSTVSQVADLSATGEIQFTISYFV